MRGIAVRLGRMALGAPPPGEAADPAGVFDQRVAGPVRAVMRIPAGRRQPGGRVHDILGGAAHEALRRRR
jgi:hypothetical protein